MSEHFRDSFREKRPLEKKKLYKWTSDPFECFLKTKTKKMGKTARIWVKNELKHMSEMFSRLSHSYNEIEFHCAGVEFSNPP